MEIDERTRHALHLRLDEVLGREEAATMMAHLPPTGWSDVATRHDLDMLRTELRGEIAELRGEFAQLRGDFGELRGEFGELRGETQGSLAEFRGEMQVALAEVTRKLVTAMITTTLTGMVIVAGLAFGAARLT